MVKVLDPDGTIIGVFENAADVPACIPNRMHTYYFPKEECGILDVTDPKDYQRLLPSLQKNAP